MEVKYSKFFMKYIKSQKRKSKKHIYSTRVNKSLYNNGKKKPKTITGYGSKEKAIETLKNIKRFSLSYQKQIVKIMFNRGKYHVNQTREMRDAMKIYNEWIRKHKFTKKN